MKRCPECNELFDDQKTFCDMDGSGLTPVETASRPTPVWMTGAIGGLIGVIVCVLLYIAFLAPGQKDTQDQARHTPDTKETAPTKPTQMAAVPLTARSVETPSPTETASPAADPSPTQAPATTPTPVALNDGPIATGGKSVNNGERAIIKMKDGSSVEADAAWEDAQGVWYRRNNLVSFVEKSKVDAITEPPQRHPAPAEAKTP